ncbi:MAG: DUF4340 domain-containing protein [Isosphaeraceae bacterium]
MKTFRATFVLIGLFFAGLLALWWLDYAGVPTEVQRRQRGDRVLADLVGTPELGIAALEIVGRGQTVAFERRGPDRWQMTRPLDVAADATAVESLIGNLRDLRKSADSGTITAAPDAYGLAPPVAVIRLWSSPRASASASQGAPLAALEIGKTMREQTYVRPAGTQGIDVVEQKFLAGIDRPVSDWRQVNLVPVPSFQVTSLAVRRQGLDLKAERGAGGRWILTAPLRAPANPAKIESTLAALASLRVLDGSKGFAADNVRDFAPFGLDAPEATIELLTTSQESAPIVLEVGKKPPGQTDRVYVRRGDQDDVVVVGDRFLPEIPRDSTAFRSQQVCDIDGAAVTAVAVTALQTTFRLERQGPGWTLSAPSSEKADTYLVQSLLNRLDGLQTSEFLDPARVPRPELDPPNMTVKLWEGPSARSPTRRPGGSTTSGSQTTSGGSTSSGSSPDSSSQAPALVLGIGRHDRLRKTVYGQLEGDTVILALPDGLLDVLPRNRLAYRDRTVLALGPASVTKLTLLRDGTTTVLEPDRTSSTPNQWRMKSPVEAPADARAITQLLALLSDLRADEFIASDQRDGKLFGLDQPLAVVSWETSAAGSGDPTVKGRAGTPGPSGRLRMGKTVPGKPGAFYAALDGQPFVFTLGAPSIQPIAAEFHESRVLSFPADAIRRMVFHTPQKAIAFGRVEKPTGGPADWHPELPAEVRGIDLSRFPALVQQLSELRTSRFFQYEGPFPAATGLSSPRLCIELHEAAGKPPLVLRLGVSQGDALYAAAGKSTGGAVFLLLPAAPWNALVESFAPVQELPADVFAP